MSKIQERLRAWAKDIQVGRKDIHGMDADLIHAATVIETMDAAFRKYLAERRKTELDHFLDWLGGSDYSYEMLEDNPIIDDAHNRFRAITVKFYVAAEEEADDER